MRQEWIIFELEYLKRLSYFQADSLLLIITILYASVFYLVSLIQNIFWLQVFVPIVSTPLIIFLIIETIRDGISLSELMNDKMKELTTKRW